MAADIYYEQGRYSKASDLGDIESMIILPDAYSEGDLGLEIDIESSLIYYKRAAGLKDTYAIECFQSMLEAQPEYKAKFRM